MSFLTLGVIKQHKTQTFSAPPVNIIRCHCVYFLSYVDIPFRRINRQSYLSTGFSSDGNLSEEEEGNTTEPDTTPSQPSGEMLSSLELSKCSSDGLSDRENVVRRIKCQVKQHMNAAAGEHRLQPVS